MIEQGAARLDKRLFAVYPMVVSCSGWLGSQGRREVLREMGSTAHPLPMELLENAAMNELLVILAISVMIIGFLILVGIALWLAMERRRSLAAQSQPAPQRGGQPGQPPAQQQPASQGAPAAAPAPATPPAAAGQAGSEPAPGNPPPKEPRASGEYPSAALYDQTLLPQPPKRRTRPPSE